MSVATAKIKLSKEMENQMSKIEMTNGYITLSFDTWEEWDAAVCGVASFFVPTE